MSKVVQRLIIFFLGIPVILAIVYFDFLGHLPFNVLLVLTCALAACELSVIFNANGETLPKPLLIVLSAAIPICAYLDMILDVNYFYSISFIIAVFIIFLIEIFGAKTFESSNARIARSICVVLYAGFLPAFLTRLTNIQNSSDHLMTFLVLVFISDSAAWLFGVLFGKNNRGKVAASPNKSIMGFVGAYLGCILFAYLFAYIFFEGTFVPSDKLPLPKAARVFVVAIVVCTSSIVGDLAESVFKRSANIKDSGNIVLGRGGILDCVDSIFMAAPFYYYLVRFLFK